MKTTFDDAPVAQSFAERIELEKARKKQLEARLDDVCERIILAQIDGNPLADLRKEREGINQDLEDIDGLLKALDKLACEQRRAELVDALVRRQRYVRDVLVPATKKAREAKAVAEKELDDANKLLEKLASESGVGKPQSDLRKHEIEYPSVSTESAVAQYGKETLS